MRDPLTDTPDWRYGTALVELDREQRGLPVYEPSTDMYVKMLKRVLPFRNQKRMFLDPDKRRYTEHVESVELVLNIYEDQAVAGLRDIMEAALLAKDSDSAFFQSHVSRGLDERLVKLYRDMFYDIDEQKDMPFWVHRNLFVPNRNISNSQKFDSAYMWKVVAYHGGISHFVQYAVDGMGLNDELKLWFRKMGVSEYVRQVLKSSHSYAKLLDGAGTPALPMTATWEKQQDTDTGAGEDTTGAAKALAEAIDRPGSDIIQEVQIISENKFSDEDAK